MPLPAKSSRLNIPTQPNKTAGGARIIHPAPHGSSYFSLTHYLFIAHNVQKSACRSAERSSQQAKEGIIGVEEATPP
jgi:hypothetical protein